MFRHLSIRVRLFALMTLATAAVFTVGGSALLNMRAANRAGTELVAAGQAVRASMQADMLHDAVHAQVMAAALASLRGDAAGLKAAAEAVDADTAELQANIARAAELSPNERAASAARAATPVAAAYAAAAKKFVEAARLNPQGLAAEQERFETSFEALKVALEASGDGILSAADAIAEEAAQDGRRNALLTVMAIIGAVGLLTVGLIWVVGSISRSVRGILEAVERLNRDEQDLSVRLPPGTGEFRRITDGMNRFLDRVAHTVGGMRAGAEDILQASGQIAAGNQHLAERTDHATSGLQQTASSVEQITRTIAQSADAARQADALARSAADVAERGGEVVQRVVDTMGEIDASARKIADITGVIDGIAFQTNILALNAAVEAARAGEQGRGFAVVASEVRMLAQRSAEAAREIKALIGSSVERVESGTALAGDAGRTMQEIVGSVRRVSDMIAEVTHAADEQNSGIGLVNQAVVDLDRITQQNATLVQETAAAAQQMNDRASELARTVGALQSRDADAAVAA